MKQKKASGEKGIGISAEQVRAYLAEHTDFFVENEDLLEILSVPHPSGNAISLIEKQLAIYREQNKKFQSTFEDLMRNARKNEQLLENMHKLALALLDATDLENAIAELQTVLHDQFDSDFVSVRIIREDNASALAELFVPIGDARLKPFEKIIQSGRPKCDRPNPEHAEFLFGENARNVQSCAIVPFQVAGTKGLLGIGSCRKERFSPELGNFFLSRIGEMVGYRLSALLDETGH